MFGERMGEDAIKIYEGGQAMTKEEAIQELERFNREGRIFATSVHEAIDIAIKTIKENSAEIKTLTQTNKSYKGMIRKKDRQINSKNGTINALQCALKERTEERDRKDNVVTKQNKIIDLMADLIYEISKVYPGTVFHALIYNGFDLSKCDGRCQEKFETCKECIKQHFERKSEE